MHTQILSLIPTPLLRRRGDGSLAQTARLALQYEGESTAATVRIRTGSTRIATSLNLTPGESTHDVETPEVTSNADLSCEVQTSGGELLARAVVPWQPPRRWVVHVVQLSHHDVGYTERITRRRGTA